MARPFKIEITDAEYLEKSLRNARTVSQTQKQLKAVVAQEWTSEAALLSWDIKKRELFRIVGISLVF